MHDRPHDEALLALLYDELPPAEADALREKLAAEDPQSLDRLAEWQAIRAAVADLPEVEPDPQIHYDVIREARRAVEAEKAPSRLWAWLEQLTLMPALAGLLLVVLAAGLTLRLTTDLESADDLALVLDDAPGQAEAPASKVPVGKQAPRAAATKASAAPEERPRKDSAELQFGAAGAAAEQPTPPAVAPDPAPGAMPTDAPEAEEAPLGGIGDARLAKAGEKQADSKAPLKRKAAAEPSTREEGGGRRTKVAGKVAGKKAKQLPETKKPPARPARDKALDGLLAVGGDVAAEDADERAVATGNSARAPAEDQAKVEPASRRATTRKQDSAGAEVESRAGAAGADDLGTFDAAPAGEVVESETAERERSAGGDGRRYAPPPPPAAPPAEPVAAAPAPAETAAARGAAPATDDAVADVRVAEQGRDDDDRLDRALLLRRSGLHREAVGEFEAYLAENRGASGLDRVWFEAAESYRALGQTDRALQLYRLVAGGESAYAGRARARIDAVTQQRAGDAKAGPQAAPAKAMPQAAPLDAEENFEAAPVERE